MKSLALLVFGLVCSSTLVASQLFPWKRGMSFGAPMEENNINYCLIACSMCFDFGEESLMLCANRLCLDRLKKGKPLEATWSKRCPGLKKIWSKELF